MWEIFGLHQTMGENIMHIEESILHWIEIGALAIEVIAVVIIVGAVFYGTFRYLQHVFVARKLVDESYVLYRKILAKALMLGLEILVAADIVRTVALEPSLESYVGLGLLVLIRTFLSWSLEVESEGRWPWQSKASTGEEENL